MRLIYPEDPESFASLRMNSAKETKDLLQRERPFRRGSKEVVNDGTKNTLRLLAEEGLL